MSWNQKATNKKTNEPELSAIADHDAIAFIYGFLACSTRGDPKIIVTDFHVFKWPRNSLTCLFGWDLKVPNKLRQIASWHRSLPSSWSHSIKNYKYANKSSNDKEKMKDYLLCSRFMFLRLKLASLPTDGFPWDRDFLCLLTLQFRFVDTATSSSFHLRRFVSIATSTTELNLHPNTEKLNNNDQCLIPFW
jgi:hypothetical protein